MKQRILTAIIGLSLLGVILFFYDTVVFNLAISLISACCVFEFFKAAKCLNNPAGILGVLAAFLIPLFPLSFFASFAGKISLAVYIMLLILILLKMHNTLSYKKLCIILTGSLFISFSVSCLIYVRDEHKPHGLFFVMFILAMAWIADAGAYFIGSTFGKHKLAPQISPKKSIEGAVGGIATNVIFAVLMVFIYSKIMSGTGNPVSVSYQWVIINSLFLSFVAIVGDLGASVVKRQCEVKDFGSVMPGHGGFLDRFDSVLIVAPFVYILSQAVNMIA